MKKAQLFSIFIALAVIASALTSLAAGPAPAPAMPSVLPVIVPDAAEAPGSGNEGGIRYELERQKMVNMHKAELAKEKAKKESKMLIDEINLSCVLADAEQIGSGQTIVDGKPAETKVYEVACKNGMGYILMSQGTQPPKAISCFAAQSAFDAATARGDQPDLNCQLSANADLKAMATLLMTHINTPCAVNNVRSIGITNDPDPIEYIEVSCPAATGYVIKIPYTGSAVQITAIRCADVKQQGAQCRFNANGTESKPPSKQVYLDALKQNGIKCNPSQFRMIGREVVGKRYVIEASCPEQPAGLIAFIPSADSSGKFEAIDCDAAAKLHINCEFRKQ